MSDSTGKFNTDQYGIKWPKWRCPKCGEYNWQLYLRFQSNNKPYMPFRCGSCGRYDAQRAKYEAVTKAVRELNLSVKILSHIDIFYNSLEVWDLEGGLNEGS